MVTDLSASRGESTRAMGRAMGNRGPVLGEWFRAVRGVWEAPVGRGQGRQCRTNITFLGPAELRKGQEILYSDIRFIF